MANETMLKFGYPEALLREFEHWVVLLRPAQVTLASLVLAAKSEATAFADLSQEAFTELAHIVRSVEMALGGFSKYDRINYLMLMMVDRQVHFHVIPRYSEPRRWNDLDFPDQGWPGPPQLKLAVELSKEQTKALAEQLKPYFYS